MIPFDEEICALADSIGGHYRRYCDDILWLCSADDEDRVRAAVTAAILERKLEINDGKTDRSTFDYTEGGELQADRPLQYLGFTFDGQRRLLRSSTLSRFYRRMRLGVRQTALKAKDNHGHRKLYRTGLHRRFSVIHRGRQSFPWYGKRSGQADSLEDLEMAMSHPDMAKSKERDEIPPEVEAEILARFMQEHLMSWLDEEIPMLGGKTPRQVVRMKGGREKVIAMLRDQENLYSGRPGADRVDFTAPYMELGLKYEE